MVAFDNVFMLTMCGCLGTDEMVNAVASRAQSLLMLEIRNRSSVGHYPLESEVTDHVPEFHEIGTSKDLFVLFNHSNVCKVKHWV